MLRKNLSYLMPQRGVSQSEVARATGGTQPTINRILSGESEGPRTANVKALADYFGVTADALREKDFRQVQHIAHAERGIKEVRNYLRRVPVKWCAVAELKNNVTLEPSPVREVDYPAIDNSTYAIRVQVDTLRPRIKSGELVIVEPSTEPEPGDDVLVLCKDGRRLLKELMYAHDDTVTLGALNGDDRPLTVPREDIEAIHYIAAIRPRSALIK